MVVRLDLKRTVNCSHKKVQNGVVFQDAGEDPHNCAQFCHQDVDSSDAGSFTTQSPRLTAKSSMNVKVSRGALVIRAAKAQAKSGQQIQVRQPM